MPARPSSASTSRPPPPLELDAAAVAVDAAAVTVKLAEPAADDPAAFAQVSVYVSVPAAVGVRVCVPLVANAPLQLPVAVQPVELAEDQVSVVELPTATELAAKVRVGAAGTTCGMSANAASACTNP